VLDEYTEYVVINKYVAELSDEGGRMAWTVCYDQSEACAEQPSDGFDGRDTPYINMLRPAVLPGWYVVEYLYARPFSPRFPRQSTTT
jgi:hypothetical protein